MVVSVRVWAAACFVAAVVLNQATAQEVPKTPQVGVEIDGNKIHIVSGGDGWNGVVGKVQALRKILREKDAEVISVLSEKMDTLPPPYIYELVRRTCSTNPERALYLFHLAGSRMRYDALRCVDPSAKAGVQATLFALQMPECKEMFSMSDSGASLAALRRLRDAKELLESKASPWWICSHGIGAIRAGLEKRTLAVSEWLKPEAEWPAIQAEIKGQIDYTLEKHSKK